MGPGNMKRVKIVARRIALVGMLFGCAPASWAGQGQKPSTKTTPAAKPAASAPAARHEAVHERDPFAPLIRTGQPGGHLNLPPGIAGLQISTLQLEGMVEGAKGTVAVVSNPEDHVYFLHDGDQLYDGVVGKIGLNEVTFRQESKDAFGRTVETDVTKRLYPIAGEQQ